MTVPWCTMVVYRGKDRKRRLEARERVDSDSGWHGAHCSACSRFSGLRLHGMASRLAAVGLLPSHIGD